SLLNFSLHSSHKTKLSALVLFASHITHFIFYNHQPFVITESIFCFNLARHSLHSQIVSKEKYTLHSTKFSQLSHCLIVDNLCSTFIFLAFLLCRIFVHSSFNTSKAHVIHISLFSAFSNDKALSDGRITCSSFVILLLVLMLMSELSNRQYLLTYLLLIHPLLSCHC